MPLFSLNYNLIELGNKTILPKYSFVRYYIQILLVGVTMKDVFELCGWAGAILVLIAYYLVTSGKAKGDSTSFQAINIGGALLLVAYTYNCNAYASMIVNIIWVVIGMTSVIKLINFSKLKMGGNYLMKTRGKAILMASLLAVIAISAPAIADTESELNDNLYAQVSDESSDEDAGETYDFSDGEETESVDEGSDSEEESDSDY
jgi:uncharacterized membrane protein YuzA (DUF378 family)